MKTFRETLTDAIQGTRSIRKRIASPLSIDPAVLLAGREAELASKEELATLRAFQRRSDELQKQLIAVDHDAATREIRALRAAYQASPTSANLQAIKHGETNIIVRRDPFGQLRRQVKQALRTLAAELGPLVGKVMRRAATIIEREATQLRETEASAAARFQCEFHPSPTVIALEDHAWQLSEEARVTEAGLGAASPAASLAHLLKL